MTPVTPADVREALLAQATKLADCPAALDFLTRPDIKSFYLLNFGQALDPEHTWVRACPAASELQKSYEASRGSDRHNLVANPNNGGLGEVCISDLTGA